MINNKIYFVINFAFCSEEKVPFQGYTDSLTSSMMAMSYDPCLVPMDQEEDLEEDEEYFCFEAVEDTENEAEWRRRRLF